MLTDTALLESPELPVLDMPVQWQPLLDRAAPVSGALPDAVRQCRAIAGSISADSYGLFFLGPQADGHRLVPVFDDEFPGVSLLSRTISSREAEPFARQLAGSAVPLWWRPNEEPSFLTATARAWTTQVDCLSPGTSAIAFPVSVERVRAGAIVFAGNEMMLDEAALCDTHARCFSLFSEVARQRTPTCAKTPVVSKREIECLRLTANGLTSDAIAATLGLSVHTANQYLTNSTQKLNAVNRIHAVAKAIRCGLID
jgi:DNA-binding CsgD family transcriptional regulator